MLFFPLVSSAADKLVVKDAAGTTKFMVNDSGQVGIGTTTPDQFVHIKNDANAITALRIENDNIIGASSPSAQESFVLGPTGAEHLMLQVLSDAHTTMPRAALINAYTHDLFIRTNAQNVFKVIRTGAVENTLVLTNGYVGIGRLTPTYPLHMASGARVTTGGVWTNASSREYKENIQELSATEAVDTLAGLDPVKYNYKVDVEDKHVGFIAEDVPDLVATKDRKGLSSMDIVAVLTKVVQEQQKTISELTEKVADLQREVKLKGSVASAK
jgi:hypothetical protein